ncbi:CerR family C-terminal domain-containing protein [Limnoglobus roseus]|uniref:HTH tetR-type domain-containing protein n=1 Tax=Limnoglobus roseus TaxID=2598579 RepID=A0A5C1AJC8_9BACT|nr:CerR family C-terminal domain-containing protein [Limnoglobus roseus]QEL18106.1 hypothetical protein PX52LOC_05120 [Limnoglobus roseus]
MDFALDAKERLLDAAEEVFADKGFNAATIREIINRANVNIAAVNYYFGDKERLYIEAVKYAHQCSWKGLPQPESSPDATPVEKLRLFIRMMATWTNAIARPSSVQLVMREMLHPTAAAREIVRESIQPTGFRLRAIVEELFPGIEEGRCLMIGFSIMGQILFYKQNRRVAELIFGKEPVAALETESVIEHITQFTLAALGQGPPVNGRPS